MSTEIVTRLKALKLHGMAANWPELLARCRHAALESQQLVEQLLDAEGAERNVRSIAQPSGVGQYGTSAPGQFFASVNRGCSGRYVTPLPRFGS